MEVFFSVIIPLYNKEHDIYDTLTSVLNQTYNQFEIIVVNDGSTDNGEIVVKKFADERIKLYTIKNSGVSVARNYGVQVSKGNYIAFLDADDYWYPFHLANLNSIINSFSKGLWFATAYEIMHNERLILPMNVPPMRYGENWIGEIDNFFKNSLRDCMAWTSAVCMRKDFFTELGGFNIQYRNGQDVDLWIRAAIESNLYFSNRVSSRYNFLASNRISTTNVLNKTIIDFDQYDEDVQENKWLKKYLDLNRYSFAVRYKLNKARDLYSAVFAKIDIKSLSIAQRILIKMPAVLLVLLMKVKQRMENMGVRLRSN